MITTTTTGYETIAERVTGCRTVMGTDWPIIDKIEVFRPTVGWPDWTVTLGLCNGVPAETRTFSTGREALEFYADNEPAHLDSARLDSARLGE